MLEFSFLESRHLL